MAKLLNKQLKNVKDWLVTFFLKNWKPEKLLKSMMLM